MKLPTKFLSTVFCLGLFACNETSTGPEEDLIVVRAYLFAGEPVTEIFLSSPQLIGSEETAGPPIIDAAVSLMRNGTEYSLVHDSLRPGYYLYPGTNLLPGPGDQFSLEIAWAGSYATATTVVPTAPFSVTSNQDTLTVELETVDTPFGSTTRVTSDDSLVVSWNGNSEDLYYTIVQNIEENPTPIIQDEDTTFLPFSFISQPVSQLQHRVFVPSLNYLGNYIVKVFHVNQEYADLYRSREQDTRNLNEPLTNIKGGLGVFSAFAADSIKFYVKLE